MNLIRKERKKQNITFILMYLLLISILVVNYSISRYKTTYNTTAQGTAATWTFNINNQSTQTFTINLASTTDENLNYDRTKNVIAPGASGKFNIKLDCTNCKVSLNYTITLATNANSDMPSEIIFYTVNDDQTRNILVSSDLGQTKTLTGTMNLTDIQTNPIKTVVINWIWQINQNIDESKYEGKDFYIDASVVGSQIVE